MRVLKQPLAGVYVSFFVMVTLLILVGSTWMGLYLAKRITRPVQMLSEAAKEIGAGHYDHRIEHEGTDEFGSMVEAFNAMAAEVSQSRQRLERASIDLERKHDEGEGRRRYIYSGVPADVYHALCDAESAGRFINGSVKGRYECRCDPPRRRYPD